MNKEKVLIFYIGLICIAEVKTWEQNNNTQMST